MKFPPEEEVEEKRQETLSFSVALFKEEARGAN